MPIQQSINQAIGSVSQLTALNKMSKEQAQKNKLKAEKEKTQAKRQEKELNAYHLLSVQEEQLKKIERLQKSIKTQKERVTQFKNVLRPFMTEEELAMRGNKGIASTLNRLSKGGMPNVNTKTQRT